MKNWSRRQLIKTGTAAMIGAPLLARSEFADDYADPGKDVWRGMKAGVASYTFRKFSVDDTIKAMKRLDLHLILSGGYT